MNSINTWFLKQLVCPDCKEGLAQEGEKLICSTGHRYEFIHGVPVLLNPNKILYSPVRLKNLEELWSETASLASDDIDPYVRKVLAATNGIMYKGLEKTLTRYPIPDIPIPGTSNGTLLDLGCNWGRWSIAAARKGYRVIGMDPNPEAIFAAKRVARQLGVEVFHVVGDARSLPFKEGTFDYVYSYSVLQHFSKADVRETLNEVRRVLLVGGESCIEMANALGFRSLYHQIKRGFRMPKDFEVRYWTPKELKNTYQHQIGKSRITIDGFFSLNPQPKEAPMLRSRYQWVVRISELLKGLARYFPWLSHFADSLFVISKKEAYIG